MTKIYCFVQRQDGYVAGLVSKGTDGELDMSTARLITGDSEDGEDEGKAALRILKEETNQSSDYALRFTSFNNAEIFDMEVGRFSNVILKDKNDTLMWIHPWHMAQGTTGDIAQAGFAFNDTRVVEPPKYEGRKNTTFVGGPQAGVIPPGVLPGALGALAASGTQIIGVPPGGGMTIGIGSNGRVSMNGGVPLNIPAPTPLTAQELQTMKPWDDDAFHISDSDAATLWSKVSGADFIFAIPDQQSIDENPDLEDSFVLTPASYFYNEGAWYDGHIDSTIFDNICTADMESVYSPNNGQTLAQVKSQLLAIGCQEEPKLLQ